MTDQQHEALLHALQEAARMNEGQFVAITERLERIIELLEAQASPPLFAISGENVDPATIDMKRNLLLGPGVTVTRVGYPTVKEAIEHTSTEQIAWEVKALEDAPKPKRKPAKQTRAAKKP